MFRTKYRIVKMDDLYYVQYKSITTLFSWKLDTYTSIGGEARLCPFKTQELAEEQINRWLCKEETNIEIVKEY